MPRNPKFMGALLVLPVLLATACGSSGTDTTPDSTSDATSTAEVTATQSTTSTQAATNAATNTPSTTDVPAGTDTPTSQSTPTDGDATVAADTPTAAAADTPTAAAADTPTAPGPTDTPATSGLSSAWDEFSTNVTTYLDDEQVVIETNGLPNHTSPYWSEGHELYVEPTVTSQQQMAPGNIDDFNGSFTLRVPKSPEKAGSSSSTGLGAIGIAVSGSVIYNDEEGPNVPLEQAAGGLDYSGAHTGPQSYHYHLETKAWSNDDTALIGVIADGFFLYGRKCTSTGTYPDDLDDSGGHTSITTHDSEGSYHYHIQNELYLNTYYILFPGDYQGTPNNIQ